MTICSDYIYLYSQQISDELNEKLFFNDFPPYETLVFSTAIQSMGQARLIMRFVSLAAILLVPLLGRHVIIISLKKGFCLASSGYLQL